MPFVTDDDLKLVIRDQILSNLIDADSALKTLAIAEATEWVKTALRNRYDVAAVFAATGEDRNALIVSLVRDIAIYCMSKRQNPRMIPQNILDSHKEALNVLDNIMNGKAHPDLPPLAEVDGETPKGSNNVRWGSKPSRKHDY